MFRCGKCFATLWLEGSALIEDTADMADLDKDLNLDYERNYAVKMKFVCEVCRREYHFGAVSKFKESD